MDWANKVFLREVFCLDGTSPVYLNDWQPLEGMQVVDCSGLRVSSTRWESSIDPLWKSCGAQFLVFLYFSGCVGLVGDRLGCGGLVSLQSWAANSAIGDPLGMSSFLCVVLRDLYSFLYTFLSRGDLCLLTSRLWVWLLGQPLWAFYGKC